MTSLINVTGPPDEMSMEMRTWREHGYFDSPATLGYTSYDTLNCESRFSGVQLKVHFNELNELQDISASGEDIDTGFSALEVGNDSLLDAIQFMSNGQPGEKWNAPDQSLLL